ILRQIAEPPAPRSPIRVDQALVDTLVGRSVADYEPRYGGFGHAPKFPRETLLELLLVYLGAEGESSEFRVQRSDAGGQRSDVRSQTASDDAQSRIRAMLLHTLDALAHGGIRDHL